MKNKKLISLIITLTMTAVTTGTTVLAVDQEKSTPVEVATLTNSNIDGVLTGINDAIKQALNNITSVIKKYTTSYTELPTKYDVSKDKNFQIKFNREINFATISSNTIKVVDSKGNEIPVKLKAKTSDKTVVIVSPPDGGYTEGETYALIIRKGITSLTSLKLVDETVMKFVIETSSTSGGGSQGGSQGSETGGSSQGGETGGGSQDSQTTGVPRVTSVEFNGNTIVNNNDFNNSKAYTAIDNSNMLNKNKLFVNMSVNGIQPYYYNVIADYEKSYAGAFENVDVLDLITIKREELESTNFTINFGTNIDTNSINNSTVYCLQVDGDEGFSNTTMKRNVSGTLYRVQTGALFL